MVSLSLHTIAVPFPGVVDLNKYSSHDSSHLMATSGLKTLHNEQNPLQQIIDWLRQWWKALWKGSVFVLRGTEIALRLSPFSLLTPLSIISHRLGYSTISDLSWWYFTKSMQSLGPAFVKLCQWAATRRDMFPPFVCDRLSTLHDSGMPHSWRYSDETLRAAFGNYAEKGLTVSPKVIGSGSAGQVYGGTLRLKDKDNKIIRRPVAIKILHPRYARMVDRDLQLMHTVADLLHAVPSETIQMLNFPRVTKNFDDILRRQTDLRVEGRNLERFRSNFYRTRSDEYNSSIKFPEPEMEWTTEQVLVEGLVVDSRPIADYLRDSTDEGITVRKELASPLLQGFLKMVFLDNFVHLGKL